MARQNSSDAQSILEPTQPRASAPVQPERPEDKQKPVRRATASSDDLPQQVTPDHFRQPEKNSHPVFIASARSRQASVPAAFSPGRTSQCGVGLVMTKGISLESSRSEVTSIPALIPDIPRKWFSTENYLESIASVRPRAGASRFWRPVPSPLRTTTNTPLDGNECKLIQYLTDSEHVLYGSDVESDSGDSSHRSRRSTITPLSTVHSGTPEKHSASSTIDQLRTLEEELKKLLRKDHHMEMGHSKGLLEIAKALCRDEVLKQISKTLRDRASTKFTMGRSERLILEREADIVFRMTLEGPVSPINAQIDALQAERETMRKAVTKGVNLLFERACTLVVQTTEP